MMRENKKEEKNQNSHIQQSYTENTETRNSNYGIQDTEIVALQGSYRSTCNALMCAEAVPKGRPNALIHYNSTVWICWSRVTRPFHCTLHTDFSFSRPQVVDDDPRGSPHGQHSTGRVFIPLISISFYFSATFFIFYFRAIFPDRA